MKKFLVFVGLLGLFTSSQSFALASSNVPSICYKNAEKFTEQSARNYREYDESGFWAYSCFIASNKKAVICDVSASKGDGDATDTYRTVLNRSCTKAFRVELVGEE